MQRPNPVKIQAGGSIIFQNFDAVDHSVTFEGYDDTNPANKVNNAQFTDYFLQRGIDPGYQGEEVEVVFPTPGVFHYFDRIHEGPGLTGTIEVIGTAEEEDTTLPAQFWKFIVPPKRTWKVVGALPNGNGNGNGLEEEDPWRTPLMLALIPLAGVAGYFGYQYLK